jgi:capsule polysaccharide export protein KpsE/RkpR
MATIPERELSELITSDNADLSQIGEYRVVDPNIARVRMLWNQRRFLFRVTICGFFAAILIAFLIPKRFESTTLLMPPDDQSGSGLAMAAALANKLSGGLAAMAGDVLGMKSSGDLFIGILRSRTALDDVIEKFDLKKVYGHKDFQSTRRELLENTAISEDRKSGIITIKVTDKVPQRAASIAQEYVNELNLVVNQLSTSSAHRERVFLEERLAQVKTDLESAEKDFSEFASKNGTIDIKEQGKAMVAGAASIEGQLIAAQSELQGLKQIYADNNVRVRALQARIAELQTQLKQLGGREDIVSDATDTKNGDLYPSIRKLPLLGVPYADLYRRTLVEEAVFESLTQEYELSKVAEAKEIPSVRVLDPPDVPEHKSFPPRLIIIILGTFLSSIISITLVLGKASWDETHPRNSKKILIQDIVQTLKSAVTRNK